MTPDDIKALRKDLSCTAKELAQALAIEQATVLAWEKGELFPTKQYIDKMTQLRAKGPAAIPKKARGDAPMKVLADPALWEIIRKLEALAGRRAVIRQGPARPGDQRYTFADTARLRRHLGWAPRVGLDEGLARQWAWQQGEEAQPLAAA